MLSATSPGSFTIYQAGDIVKADLSIGASARLPPVWPWGEFSCGFSLVCCWFSLLFQEGFTAGTPVIFLLKNQHFQISIWSGTQERMNTFERVVQ